MKITAKTNLRKLIQLVINEHLQSRKIQLNEYRIREGDTVDTILELELFTDTIGDNRLDEAAPDWMDNTDFAREFRRWTKIAKSLERRILRFKNVKLPKRMAKELDTAWYGGSNAYDNVDSALEMLIPIWDDQNDLIEDILGYIESGSDLETYPD